MFSNRNWYEVLPVALCCLFAIHFNFEMVHAHVIHGPGVLRPKYGLSGNQLVSSSILSKYPIYSLPASIDNRQLEENANKQKMLQERLSGKKSGFYQFGESFSVQLTSDDGIWSVSDDGKVNTWYLVIHSKQAHSLNLLFDTFELPNGAELYLTAFSDNDKQESSEPEVIGPITSRNNFDHKRFSTVPLGGNSLLLEYYAPLDTDKPELEISHIVHGYKPTGFTNPRISSSGNCNINVACSDSKGWEDQVKSVVMMLTNSGRGYCSGSMVNSVEADGRQLFLTANHCAQRDVSQDMIMFNFQSDSCSQNNNPRTKQTAQGLRSLAQYYDSDFAIFEVQEKIPDSYGAYLAGWSAEQKPFQPSIPVVGIHHPSADIKKISFGGGELTETCWRSCSRRHSPDHWKVDHWSKGTTEPGSSGSPLFDGETKRIIGQLHGGVASCRNADGWDSYGQVTASFDHGLGEVLDPSSTGTRFADGAYLADLRKSSSRKPIAELPRRPLMLQAQQ